MKEGVSIMGKFCTSCGTALNEGAKFCAKCGANASHVLEEAGTLPEQATPNSETILSKAGKQMKIEAKIKAAAYAKSMFSEATPAYQSAGELALPAELTPLAGDFEAENLLSLLKIGIKGLAGGLKRTLHDKKRLVVVIALVITWLLVNLLVSLGIFPLPLRLLSWLTAAQGSLIGGSIGKGLVAALLAQLIADQGMLQTVKSGLGQLGGIAKGLRGVAGPLLMGIAVALIVTNLMVSSNLQNTMVCLAAFLLSAKALTHHGFLRKFINALLPKANNTTLTTLMRGWTLGFALFAAISFLPGGGNGYVLGILLLLAGGLVTVVNKNKKEASGE
ncbi:MAG: zinc ribbon domain-containing protein [Dehalobacterium sp.]